ncbi:hypothetical protein OQA88_10700 [Cercophora sp. LCS_1]
MDPIEKIPPELSVMIAELLDDPRDLDAITEAYTSFEDAVQGKRGLVKKQIAINIFGDDNIQLAVAVVNVPKVEAGDMFPAVLDPRLFHDGMPANLWKAKVDAFEEKYLNSGAAADWNGKDDEALTDRLLELYELLRPHLSQAILPVKLDMRAFLQYELVCRLYTGPFWTLVCDYIKHHRANVGTFNSSLESDRWPQIFAAVPKAYDPNGSHNYLGNLPMEEQKQLTRVCYYIQRIYQNAYDEVREAVLAFLKQHRVPMPNHVSNRIPEYNPIQPWTQYDHSLVHVSIDFSESTPPGVITKFPARPDLPFATVGRNLHIGMGYSRRCHHGFDDCLVDLGLGFFSTFCAMDSIDARRHHLFKGLLAMNTALVFKARNWSLQAWWAPGSNRSLEHLDVHDVPTWRPGHVFLLRAPDLMNIKVTMRTFREMMEVFSVPDIYSVREENVDAWMEVVGEVLEV